MADNAPYIDEDQQLGSLLGNVINPPDEQALPANQRDMRANLSPQATNLRFPQPAAQPAPQPAAPAPAAVTRSGNPGGQKSWADYVRGSLDRATAAQDQSQQAVNSLQNQPSVASQNTPLEQQRAQAAQPIDPNQKQYKPGIGTRIVRGLDAVRRGGILGAFDPQDAGGQAYGAPNRQYQRDVAKQTQQVGNLDQQMKENIDTSKADSDRLGKIGSEQRAGATTALDIGKTATAQQNAEDKSEHASEKLDLQQQIAELKANGQAPKTYEQAVIMANTEKDPAKRQQYQAAAKQIQDAEVRRFTLAARASGGGRGPNEDLRQPMIDEATARVQKLNDYAFDPDANDGAGGFYDPTNPQKVITPAAFTDMKNQIATKLDKDLASKKLRPLGVRFNVNDTTPGKGGAPAPAAQPAAAPKATGQAAIKAGNGQPLTDRSLATQYLQKAGGDKEKARQLAKTDGWKF